ncbi:MAG: DUF3842 family protein [Spirochaetaceae bacterium]|nr:DUF3842 family protein [Spirochaetaceae bacterium]
MTERNGANAKKSGKPCIVVIDGMGGGIGEELIRRLVSFFSLKKETAKTETAPLDIEILALATNAVAAERMVRAGAARGAAGENAIRQSVALGDFILGPIGIIIANSMLGEITPAMTESILAAPGRRILIPLQNDHIILAGMENLPLSKMIDKAVEMVKNLL